MTTGVGRPIPEDDADELDFVTFSFVFAQLSFASRWESRVDGNNQFFMAAEENGMRASSLVLVQIHGIQSSHEN